MLNTLETTEPITNSADIIDVRDIIARVEALESLPPSDESDGMDNEEREELATLTALLDEMRGNGGDVDWQGAWYPLLLVRESYFVDHAQEEADSCGLINSEARWPNNHIDWDSAAEELKNDYTDIDFDGVEYLYR